MRVKYLVVWGLGVVCGAVGSYVGYGLYSLTHESFSL